MEETDVSLDLETMGTGTWGAICAIGARPFNIETGQIAPTSFECAVSLRSLERAGFVFDGDTVEWWMGQSDEARGALFDEPIPIRDALDAFRAWFPKGARLWGNGSNFDNRLLREAYEKLDESCPWGFRQDCDMRTLKFTAALLGHKHPEVERSGVHHNALDDATFQAESMIELFAQIRRGE